MKRKDSNNLEIFESLKKKSFDNNKRYGISKESADRTNSVFESNNYVKAYKKLIERVLPQIDIKAPSTFCFYGSAQRYYESSFKHIYSSYPYDGSGLEKINWSLSASAVDLAILQHEYPKEVGNVQFSKVGWGNLKSTVADDSFSYGLSADPEYIKFYGGPHVGTRLDSESKRQSSLKLDIVNGNTIEFWLKKESYESANTQREVIVDVFSSVGTIPGASDYARLIIELDSSVSSDDNPFCFTFLTGEQGFRAKPFPTEISKEISPKAIKLTKDKVADGAWHHYAIVFGRSVHMTDPTTEQVTYKYFADLYVDGVHSSQVYELTTDSNWIPSVNSYMNGTIGSLGRSLLIKESGSDTIKQLKGYGKLNGSLDEFRFWKTARTAEQIYNYFDSPVFGASDKEQIESHLGVYYKFNEGIIGITSEDKVVLDYSGRINNGEFVGYNSQSRDSSSAISLSSNTNMKEVGDPIINPRSKKVIDSLESLKKLGTEHDRQNSTSLFNSVPTWAAETAEDSQGNDSDFAILLQIIASQFDSTKMLIDDLPKIGFTQYKDFNLSTTAAQEGKIDYEENYLNILGCASEFIQEQSVLCGNDQFSVSNLLAKGWSVDVLPIVSKANLNEYLYNIKFNNSDHTSSMLSSLIESKAENIKNKILNNVYNNLATINISKGTRTSFRNLIRCFGVDEELLSPNIYAHNSEKFIKSESVVVSKNKKVLNLTNKNNSVTLTHTSSSPKEKYFIPGKSEKTGMSFETRVIFPSYKKIINENREANIFGVNSVNSNTLQLANPNYAGFTVEVERNALGQRGGWFKLVCGSDVFESIKTEYFDEIYSDSQWLLSVRLKDASPVPLSNFNQAVANSYVLEFSGYRYESDILLQEFKISKPITEANYLNFMQSNKSCYLGASRDLSTQNIIKFGNAKIVDFFVWDDYVTDTELKYHAKSFLNIGRKKPLFKEADNNSSDYNQTDSLILHWRFDDGTIDSNSRINIVDSRGPSLFPDDKILAYSYPAQSTSALNTEDVLTDSFVTTVQDSELDNYFSRSRIEIKEREIDVFELTSRPVTYLHSYEKSMYQILSREMLAMLAGLSAFNNLIGEPVYKYRKEYKSLEKLRHRFFKNVSSVNFEGFVEYFKWIDGSLGQLLKNLQPATADMNLGLEDVVESHAFERNKYEHKYPVFEFKNTEPEGKLLSINELLYDWQHGHAPIPVSSQETTTLSSIYGTFSTEGLKFEGTNSDQQFMTVNSLFNYAGSSSTSGIKNSDVSFFVWIKIPSVSTFSAADSTYPSSDADVVDAEKNRWHSILSVTSPLASNDYDRTRINNLQNAMFFGVAGHPNLKKADNSTIPAGNLVLDASLSTSNHDWVDTGIKVDDDKFHHIGFTYDISEDSFKIYVDNTLVASKVYGGSGSARWNGSGPAIRPTFAATHYKDSDQTTSLYDHFLHATFSNITIWTQILDSDEVSELYNGGTPANPNSHSLGSGTSKLRVWYRMDSANNKEDLSDHTGTSWIDRDGTLFGIDSSNYVGISQGSNVTTTVRNEENNCLWWKDRAIRTADLPNNAIFDQNRETLRIRNTTTDTENKEGTSYVLRNLTKPYRVTGEALKVLDVGSNRKANKTKDLYKVIKSGKEIRINKNNIFEFRQCDDVLNPQREKIYMAKTDTTSTDGYLDADSDLILPFTLYSSSVGNHFPLFKENLMITNNHDDDIGILQSHFVKRYSGGEHHRHVEFGTPDKDRVEAYILDFEEATGDLVLKKPERAAALYSRGSKTVYWIGNKKTDLNSNPVILGNYDKDYQIVQTHGRAQNNNFLTDNEDIPIDPIQEEKFKGLIDYKTPNRGRTEHVFVNRFSSPGGPETQAAYARDRESGEYSVYNTLNYRNLSVRRPLDFLSKEMVEKEGYRAGTKESTNQGSIHRTNRNYFYRTTHHDHEGSRTQEALPDNFFVQHPIPQTDFGYSWIKSSAVNDVYDFAIRNRGFGHQNMFRKDSYQSVQFLSASLIHEYFVPSKTVGFATYPGGNTYGDTLETIQSNQHNDNPDGITRVNTPVDFAGLNTIIHEPLDAGNNQFGSTDYSIKDYFLFAKMDGLNDLFIDDISRRENHAQATMLNSVLLNRSGPFGWPSWKQIRGADHPIARAHRKNNTFSRVYLADNIRGVRFGNISRSATTPSMNIGYQLGLAERGRDGYSWQNAYERTTNLINLGVNEYQFSRKTKNYKDIFATNRFNPMVVTFHSARPTGEAVRNFLPGANSALLEGFIGGVPIWAKEENFDALVSTPYIRNQGIRELGWFLDHGLYEATSMEKWIDPSEIMPGQAGSETYMGQVSFRQAYQNDLTSYAEMEIAFDTFHEELRPHEFNHMLNNLTMQQKVSNLIEVNYIETIYPREINTFTKLARERELFDYWPWKSKESERFNILSNETIYGSYLFSNNFLSFYPRIFRTNHEVAYEYLSGRDRKNTVHGLYNAIDINKWFHNDGTSAEVATYITSSTWPLDSRRNLNQLPVNISNSYFTQGLSFMIARDQGTRAEGFLQNDYSTFPLGMNALLGVPPTSVVYNRRIPQTLSVENAPDVVVLAGEAKWEAANGDVKPFFDSYSEYSHESIRTVGQDHSLVPEYRMSEYVSEVLRGDRKISNLGDDFLFLTGTVYDRAIGNNLAGDLSDTDGSIFFRTYSNSDFLKYFSVVDDQVDENNIPMSHARLTLKCNAAMRFLPYQGFYPAERAVEVTNIFHENYTSDLYPDISNAIRVQDIQDSVLRKSLLHLRANASRYSSMKPLFGPGILFNSIKSGVAVDYPIFYTDFSQVQTKMKEIALPITDFASHNFMANNVSFTGSDINSTSENDCGIPRIQSFVTDRIEFEDLLNPANIFDMAIYDNEPHPSASLLYGNVFTNTIIDRPAKFGTMDSVQLLQTLGSVYPNNRRSFSKKMSEYRSAIQNFSAETVNFFLKDGHLTTIVSDPIYHQFNANEKYDMRVYLRNFNNVMYDRHSAFGPPVSEGSVTRATYELNSSAPATATVQVKTSPAAPSATSLGDLPYVSMTPTDDNTTAKIYLYDPNNFSSTGSPTNPAVTLDFKEHAGMTGFAFDGGNISNYPGYKIFHNSTEVLNFKFYDSSATSNFATLTNYNSGNSYNQVGGSGGGTVASADQTTTPWTLFINVNGLSESDLRIWIKAVSAAYLSANHSGLGFVTTQNSSGVKYTYGNASQPSNTPSITVQNSSNFLGNVVANSSLAFSSYSAGTTTYTDVPGVNNTATARYMSVRVSNGGSLLSQSALRDRLKSEIESINATAFSGEKISSSASSTGTITLTQVTPGITGNNSVGPGNLTINNGAGSGNLASIIFDNPENSIFSGGSESGDFSSGTKTETCSHGFMPYVPPFLDPDSSPYVEISFTAPETRMYGAKEIISRSTFTYYNFKEAPDNAGQNVNYDESMSLSASLNLGMCATLISDNALINFENPDASRNPVKDVIQPIDPKREGEFSRWVIQTKWETPVLDFSEVSAQAYDHIKDETSRVKKSPWKKRYWDSYYTENKAQSNATPGSWITGSIGMWHQSGSLPTDPVFNKRDETRSGGGYFLSVEPATNGNLDLARKLGFQNNRNPQVEDTSDGQNLKLAKSYRSRIGQVAERKIVKEAVIAIPYVIEKEYSENPEIRFIEFDEEYYEKALENYNNIKRRIKFEALSTNILSMEDYNSFKKKMGYMITTPNSEAPVNAIEYQLYMMDQYSVPPKFNFRRDIPQPNDSGVSINDYGPKILMYFFQFKSELDQNDLANIWQNLSPYSTDSSYYPKYSYPSDISALFGTPSDRISDLKDNVSYVSHYLDTLSLAGKKLSPVKNTSDLFCPDNRNEKTRWLVFKVKERSSLELEDIRKLSIDPRPGNVRSLEYVKECKTARTNENTPLFSTARSTDVTGNPLSKFGYNWPYDYFSFVELIKMETKIDSYTFPGKRR